MHFTTTIILALCAPLIAAFPRAEGKLEARERVRGVRFIFYQLHSLNFENNWRTEMLRTETW